jgi:hypothetical protein
MLPAGTKAVDFRLYLKGIIRQTEMINDIIYQSRLVLIQISNILRNSFLSIISEIACRLFVVLGNIGLHRI